MKKISNMFLLVLALFTLTHSAPAQRSRLKQWLGPARTQRMVSTPRYHIPVQTNGFNLNDIDPRYRVRLEWVDTAWDGAMAAYRREYGNDVRLPSPQLISRVTILPTLGYTSNSLDAGATFYKSRVNVRNYSVEATVFYRAEDGRETTLCDGGIEEEFIKAIGHWMGISCYATLNDGHDLRCRPQNGTLLTPMCR